MASVLNSANMSNSDQGDNAKNIDWQVFARTDRIYIKRSQAETNITGYLLMDLSRSMAYTYRQTLTKFDYAICLAASISYMMIHQQDPIGLMTFDDELRASLPHAAEDRISAISWLCCSDASQRETRISVVTCVALLR